jgi:hypothetical protein
MTLSAGVPVIVGTQLADLKNRKALTPSYNAEIAQRATGEICTFGLTPSITIMNLAYVLKAAHSKYREGSE